MNSSPNLQEIKANYKQADSQLYSDISAVLKDDSIYKNIVPDYQDIFEVKGDNLFKDCGNYYGMVPHLISYGGFYHGYLVAELMSKKLWKIQGESQEGCKEILSVME